MVDYNLCGNSPPGCSRWTCGPFMAAPLSVTHVPRAAWSVPSCCWSTEPGSTLPSPLSPPPRSMRPAFRVTPQPRCERAPAVASHLSAASDTFPSSQVTSTLWGWWSPAAPSWRRTTSTLAPPSTSRALKDTWTVSGSCWSQVSRTTDSRKRV